MAPAWRPKLGLALGAALAVPFCQGRPLEGGHCSLDDGVALHQHLLRLRSTAEESGPEPSREQPSKSAAARARPMIREATDGLLRRATAKLNLPSIPAVFRWDLVGKVTQWAMGGYQKPKSPAVLGLVDDVLELVAGVLASKDVATMEDAEFAHQLVNASRLLQIARRYVGAAKAPPTVVRLVDTVAEAAGNGSTRGAGGVAQALVEVANQTSGPALAELLLYSKAVYAGEIRGNMTHAVDLAVPVLRQFGAPPAVGDFLKVSANMSKHQVVLDPVQEEARTARMLATSAEQLGMPSALPEALGYVAEVIAASPSSHVLEKPEEAAKVLLHLNPLTIKLNDQLGGPAAISELMGRLVAPLEGKAAASPKEIVGLLAKASQEVGLPGTVTELLREVGAVQQGAVDSERLLDLLLNLSVELGLPEGANKAIRDARTQAKKKGGTMDTSKLLKLATVLLRKLGMPAFADIYSHVATPLITKGKPPDALVMAAIAPSLMNIMPDLERAQGLMDGAKAKILGPLMPLYERAVEKVTENMPESLFKTSFKKALSLLRPPTQAANMQA